MDGSGRIGERRKEGHGERKTTFFQRASRRVGQWEERMYHETRVARDCLRVRGTKRERGVETGEGATEARSSGGG